MLGSIASMWLVQSLLSQEEIKKKGLLITLRIPAKPIIGCQKPAQTSRRLDSREGNV